MQQDAQNQNWYRQRNWNESVEGILLESFRKTWMKFDRPRKSKFH